MAKTTVAAAKRAAPLGPKVTALTVEAPHHVKQLATLKVVTSRGGRGTREAEVMIAL